MITQFICNFFWFSLSSRYDYLLFENFEFNVKCFLIEQSIVLKLASSRQELYQRRADLFQAITVYSIQQDIKSKGRNETILSLNIKSVLGRKDDETVTSFQPNYLAYVDNKREMTTSLDLEVVYSHSFSTVIKSAAKGVIMIQVTYYQDLKEYTKGYLNLKRGIQNDSRRIDSLQIDDLALMSSVAFDHFKWYDTSLKYLKKAILMFYSIGIDQKITLPYKVKGALLKMKRQYATYHNKLVSKKTRSIGTDWKINPYPVNTGIPVLYLQLYPYPNLINFISW